MASFKSYCRHQGHIEGQLEWLVSAFSASCASLLPRGIEIFDAAFFNIPDQARLPFFRSSRGLSIHRPTNACQEVRGMDPEQRIFMETGRALRSH